MNVLVAENREVESKCSRQKPKGGNSQPRERPLPVNTEFCSFRVRFTNGLHIPHEHHTLPLPPLPPEAVPSPSPQNPSIVVVPMPDWVNSCTKVISFHMNKK